MATSDWNGCYETDGWKGIIPDRAMEHPSKFTKGLILRIVKHLFEMGWVEKGSLVLDPFGGVGLGGLVCCKRGLRWIGVEVERSSVDAALDVFARNHCGESGTPPTIIHGDSRKLLEVLEGVVECEAVVSSPPFAVGDTADASSISKRKDKSAQWIKKNTGWKTGYGDSPGQLARMKEGPFDLVLGGPPASQQQTGGGLAAVQDGVPYTLTTKAPARNCGYQNVGSSKGQTAGMEHGDFWKASRTILNQCWVALKAGGRCVWVTKDCVREGSRVPFSDIWQAHCEAAGFKLVCSHRAMMVKEVRHDTFFGEETKSKSRKSLFRRIQENKGAPPIDWEDVRCFVKSETRQ